MQKEPGYAIIYIGHIRAFSLSGRRKNMEKRRDNKNRILKTGESQRTDGRYAYKYTDAFGNVQFVYAWKLVPTDRTPAFVVNIYNNENEEMFSEDDYGQEIDDMLITENDDMTDNDLEVVLGCKVF